MTSAEHDVLLALVKASRQTARALARCNVEDQAAWLAALEADDLAYSEVCRALWQMLDVD